ncbi:hypothetical protein OQA88_191 [Cercophora sp. LCS_1]
MATLGECLEKQKKHGILQAPTGLSPVKATAHTTTADTKPTLKIALQNKTTTSNVWAYITGLDVNRSNAVFILSSDGITPYHPTSPPKTISPMEQDIHIKLGPPGSTRTVTVPQLVGGRIYFSLDAQLTFFLNPGPALVEPSVMNPTDPNYNLTWSFAEFTYNKIQLFANITHVDFVSIPISLGLTSTNTSVPPQVVPGIPPSGLQTIASSLRGLPGDWPSLIVPSPTSSVPLRILSPNSAIKVFPWLFNEYYAPYVSRVWSKYQSVPLRINTQAQWGRLAGVVNATTDTLDFPVGSFPRPSTADIFSCDTGAFARYKENTEVMGNITARLAAALNRSTLLENGHQPDGEVVERFYKESVTNHYSRVVHEASLDGKGYAFPYDDVAAREEDGVAGVVAGSEPGLFLVGVGGVVDVPARGGLAEMAWEAVSELGSVLRVVWGWKGLGAGR